MKSLLIVALAFASTAAYAQTTEPVKPKPFQPIVASEHDGPGRLGVRLIFPKSLGGLPQIAALTRGGPAADFGFKVGDVILKIDKNSTLALTEDECRLALHGQPGTGVELTVQRGDDPLYIIRAVERRVLSDQDEEQNDSIVETTAKP